MDYFIQKFVPTFKGPKINEEFFKFCKNGDLLEVNTMIKENNIKINEKDQFSQTPLIHALMSGHEEIVKLLLQHDADPNIIDNFNKTPLAYAVSSKKIELVKNVIENTVDFNKRIDGSYENTILHHTVLHGTTEILELLINHTPKDIPNFEGKTPLHYSAFYNKPDMTEILLKASYYPNALDNYSRTPLIHSAISGSEKNVKLLLNAKADITIKDSHNYTALKYANQAKFTKIIKLLEIKMIFLKINQITDNLIVEFLTI